MSELLEKARSKVPFQYIDLSYLMWDGKENWERLQNFQKLCNEDPLLRQKPSEWGISRMENYDLHSRKAKQLLSKASIKDVKEFATLCFTDALVGSLHYEMFLPTILNLGTEEQLKLFYEPAIRYEIVGCYAQTEMAHGSDVNRIETTATWEKDHFVIHTPSLGATKWWGSDMGLTSTHVVCQAQLIVNGKRHGVQNFVVPIRDVKTHQPLPGIKVGDIGPKFGFNTKDNGYLTFYQVKIPINHMLSKYVSVQPDGTVKKTGDDKIWHATMQLMRQHFLDSSWKILGQTLTIAIRYSLQRTQFKGRDGIEIPIINYQLQQHKLIPILAEMYGNLFGSKRILKMAKENVQRVQNNDFSYMMEIHVVLAAAKAFYTWNTFFALDRIRQSLGGHGYSLYSGIGFGIFEFSACVAAEGDNTVLSLSVGKLCLAYLQKAMSSGKAPNATCDYLEDITTYLTENVLKITDPAQLRDKKVLRELLRYNVAYNVANAGQKLAALMGEGITFRTACDHHLGILLNEITRTQSNYFTMKVFVEELEKLPAGPLRNCLEKVCLLYGVLKVLETEAQLFEYGVLTGQNFKWIKDYRDELIVEINEFAIGLVEPIGYTDTILRSAIGRSDGKMYETMFKWASEENPVNDPAFHQQVFNEYKKFRGPSIGAKL